jgi:hypothetical protein
MNIQEAWNQAADTTGADDVGTELGLSLAIVILLLEVAWWFGLGMLIRTRKSDVTTPICSKDDA